jgi:hypothetical protein
MQHQYRPGEYASALLRLERNKQYGMTLAAAGKDHDLLQRIETILGIQRRKEHPMRKFSFAMLTLVGILLFNIVVSIKPKTGENNIQLALNSSLNPYWLASSNPAVLNQNNKTNSVFNTKKTFAPDNLFVNDAIAVEDTDTDDPIENKTMPGALHASYFSPVVPELSPSDEKKVKSTINATRKILEENQWKEMEKSYADAFNSAEKEALKDEYKKELQTKVDWETFENKLRLSYNQVNWEQINEQLITSLAQIKIDSVSQQLLTDQKNLAHLETWMKENNLVNIPDSDISLSEISKRQNLVKQQLEKVKTARVKKVVRL